MGGGQSTVEVSGFRIFKVNPSSPAFDAGLEVFFDFIVEIAGFKMDSHQKNFFEKIQEAENQRTQLLVYNIRTRTEREVYVTPKKWGGAGLLGAVVRYDELENSDNQGIRVLDVFSGSPAAQAGLIPNKDYLLGTTEVMFRDMDELGEVVNLCIGRKMQIYVYNSDSESIREVTIIPNTDWGGEGAIGADIRTGMLHRIPAPRRTGQATHIPPGHDLLTAQVPQQPAVSSAAGVATAASTSSDAPPSGDVNNAQQYVWCAEQKRYVYQEAVPNAADAAAPAASAPSTAATTPPASAVDSSSQPASTNPPASVVPPPGSPPASLSQSTSTGDSGAAQLPAAAMAQPSLVPPTAAVVQGASSVLAGMSANQQPESPNRSPAAPVAEPGTPAMLEPPKVPPCTPANTPMNGYDAQTDGAAFMSPSVVNIPDNIQGRLQFSDNMENTLTPGVIEESPAAGNGMSAPGVIFETPASVPVA